MIRVVPTLIVPTLNQTLICGVDFWKAFGIARELFQKSHQEGIGQFTELSSRDARDHDWETGSPSVNLLQKEDLLSEEEDQMKVNGFLSEEQEASLARVKKHFAVSSDDFIGKTHLLTHNIETPSISETEGIRSRPYPISPYLQQLLQLFELL